MTFARSSHEGGCLADDPSNFVCSIITFLSLQLASRDFITRRRRRSSSELAPTRASFFCIFIISGKSLTLPTTRRTVLSSFSEFSFFSLIFSKCCFATATNRSQQVTIQQRAQGRSFSRTLFTRFTRSLDVFQILYAKLSMSIGSFLRNWNSKSCISSQERLRFQRKRKTQEMSHKKIPM